MTMHDGGAELDAAVVGRLVAAQVPDLAGLPASEVRSIGTVNAIYRPGSTSTRGCPAYRGSSALEREWRWLPERGASLMVPLLHRQDRGIRGTPPRRSHT